MTMDTNFSVKVVKKVPQERIEGLLVGAFEGGSNYWIRWAKTVVESGKFYEEAFGHGIRVKAQDEKHTRLLNRIAMEKGLEIMAADYPKHLADFLDGNDDATTADVFLQCCLYGTLVYG
jgi:hypothetical protein